MAFGFAGRPANRPAGAPFYGAGAEARSRGRRLAANRPAGAPFYGAGAGSASPFSQAT